MLHCHTGALQVNNKNRYMKYVLLFIIQECLHTSEFDLYVNLFLILFLFFHISCSAPAELLSSNQ